MSKRDREMEKGDKGMRRRYDGLGKLKNVLNYQFSRPWLSLSQYPLVSGDRVVPDIVDVRVLD